MATTTNFGWETPDDTDLVKDGALAMRTLGNSIDTSMADLKGGTSGQILSKNSNTDMDFVWINNDQGDITAVTAGTGLTGGGTSGAVTVSLSSPVAATLGGTAQTTYATGDLLYASAADTLAKRSIGTSGQVLTVSGGVPTWATPSSGATFVGCKVYKTTEQTIANASWTDLTWDAESWDTDSFHSTSTNTARLTIPTGKGGKYLITTQPGWVANSTGSRNTRILLNGSTAVASGNWTMALTTGDATYHANSHILNLSAGDYITIQIGQGSGGNLNTASGEANINASITYLGA